MRVSAVWPRRAVSSGSRNGEGLRYALERSPIVWRRLLAVSVSSETSAQLLSGVPLVVVLDRGLSEAWSDRAASGLFERTAGDRILY